MSYLSLNLVYAALTIPILFSISSCICMEKPNWANIKKYIRTEYPSVKQLSTGELSDWLQKKEKQPPILFDVRELEEYQVSHLKNAIQAVSRSAVLERLSTADKNKPIVLYCSVGYRSSKLAAELQTVGFKQVYNLEGSIFQWANEGRMVYSDGTRVSKVHPYNSKWGQLLNRELWSELD